MPASDDELLPFRQRTIGHMLERRVQAFPGSPILRIGGRTLSAAGLHDLVGRAAHGFGAIGIRSGSIVGLLAPTSIEMITAWLALARAGAVAVPINTAARAPQIAYVLRNSGAEALVAYAACLEDLDRVGQPVSDLRHLVVIGSNQVRSVGAGRTPVPWAQLVADTPPSPESCPEVDPASLAVVLYTGGTTGPAKGVMCSQSQYYWWARLVKRAAALKEREVWYTCLPFFHVNAQCTFLATMLAGACTAARERFSASRYWGDVRDHDADVASLLGTMAHVLFHGAPPREDDRAHCLRAVFCPGMPAPIQIEFERRFGVKVLNAYGSTELNCVTATRLDEPTRPGSMGRVLDEFEMCIVDGDDQEVPDGVPGELVVRPRQPFSIMLGYRDMPERTVEAWRNLWFHTGDRGVRDGDGHFYFLERLRDVIRRRGENISSFEVEQVVNSHDGVLESAAYGVPADVGEDEVMVSVVPRESARIDLSALLEWCTERLPYFAVPRFVEIVHELPKTPVGRVEKFKLVERGVRETTWDGRKSVRATRGPSA